jgi:hypothetical protein
LVIIKLKAMKKIKNTNYFLVLLTASMLLASCKKGDVGPQGATGSKGTDGTNGTNGAAGPTGPKGADGSNGATGPQGPAGTANVIYSDWTVAKNFRDTIADNSQLHAADLPAPKLTAALLNNATVMIYLDFGGGVYTLPYTSYAGGKLNTVSFWPRVGHFIITRFTADNSNSVALSTLLKYRYVIIPGGISATAVANHVSINNYESVKQYYGIKN